MKTLTKILMNTGLTLFAVRALFGGCTPLRYSNYDYGNRLPVDQVFSTHNGYQISYADSSKLNHEINFSKDDAQFGKKIPADIPQNVRTNLHYLDNKMTAFVIRDLSPGSRGYVDFACWNQECSLFVPKSICHAEIHIPTNQKLEPGYEAVRAGKSTTYYQMGEIQ